MAFPSFSVEVAKDADMMDTKVLLKGALLY